MIHRDSAREQWPGWAHRGRRFRGSEPPGSGLVDGGGFFFCFFLECSQSWSKHRSLGKRKVTSLNKSYLLFSFLSLLEISSLTSLCGSLSYQSVQFSRSVVSDSATPWIAARQASLSITNSRNLLKLMSIESVMPSNHLILCHPLFHLPPIPHSIRVISSESLRHMRWPPPSKSLMQIVGCPIM